MNGRSLAAFALLAVALLAVASAVAQVADDPAPPAADVGSTADAEPPVDDPDAVATVDTGEPVEASEAGEPPAEPDAEPATVRDAGASEARRVITRRREAALVGGWVASTHDTASYTVTVDDIVLGANGEWTRRTSRISSDQGLLAPPDETSGTWFTEETTVVLLDRGSAVDERLRSVYLIDDRSEQLTLELDGGPVVYYRYR
jgi:hypothetical protein